MTDLTGYSFLRSTETYEEWVPTEDLDMYRKVFGVVSKTWQDDCIVERIYLQTGTTQRPGGQQAGIPTTAVRITHEPTGTMAQFGERRSEHENKRVAMSMIEYALIEAKWI